MFDTEMARKIQDAIAENRRAIPTIEDIRVRMSLVPSNSTGSYTVYVMQYGDLTILVHLSFDENGKLISINSKFVSW